jgi:hypothetical protein
MNEAEASVDGDELNEGNIQMKKKEMKPGAGSIVRHESRKSDCRLKEVTDTDGTDAQVLRRASPQSLKADAERESKMLNPTSLRLCLGVPRRPVQRNAARTGTTVYHTRLIQNLPALLLLGQQVHGHTLLMLLMHPFKAMLTLEAPRSMPLAIHQITLQKVVRSGSSIPPRRASSSSSSSSSPAHRSPPPLLNTPIRQTRTISHSGQRARGRAKCLAPQS